MGRSQKRERREKDPAATGDLAGREHYESAQIINAPSRKPRFTFIYNTIFYMSLFGALGGLFGWAFGIMLYRPNAQAEGRNQIAQYEQIQHTGDEQMTDLGRLEQQVTGSKLAEVKAQENAIASQLERQLRGVKRDGRDNEYFQLYLKHRDGALTDKQYTIEQGDLAERDNWKNFIANVIGYGIAGMMIAACLGMAESIVERNLHGAIIQGSVGAVVGLAGGIVVSFFDERIYTAIAGTGNTTDAWRLILRAPRNGACSDYSSAWGPACFFATPKSFSSAWSPA